MSLLLAVPFGLAIGLALGALGGGGSILTVPVLVYALGQGTGTATTSALLIVGVTALIALVTHARAGHVRAGQGLLFGVLGSGGAALGSLLSVGIGAPLLLSALAALMLVVAALMVRRSVAPATPDHADVGTRRASPALLVLAASGVGLITGFFGVGGGFAVVPALVLVLGMPVPVAVGTSLLVIAVNSTAALLARLHTHADLDWALIGLFGAAAVAGSLFGGLISARAQPARLSLAFAGLLTLTALYTASRSLPQLLT